MQELSGTNTAVYTGFYKINLSQGDQLEPNALGRQTTVLCTRATASMSVSGEGHSQ